MNTFKHLSNIQQAEGNNVRLFKDIEQPLAQLIDVGLGFPPTVLELR